MKHIYVQEVEVIDEAT